jgi:hypothetical protein
MKADICAKLERLRWARRSGWGGWLARRDALRKRFALLYRWKISSRESIPNHFEA